METQQKTILESLSEVHILSKGSKLELAKYKTVQNEVQQIAAYFQINEIQSIILTSIFNLSCLDEIQLHQLIKYFNITKIEFLPYLSHLQFLIDKKILSKLNDFESKDEYFIKKHLIEYIITNKQIPEDLIKIQCKEDNFYDFLKQLEQLTKSKNEYEIEHYFFIHEIKELIDENKKYKLVDYAFKNLEVIEIFLFFWVVLDAINHGENNYQTSLQNAVNNFTFSKNETFDFISKFIDGKSNLTKLNLIEMDNAQFSNDLKIQLSDKGIKMLFEMEGLKFNHIKNNIGLMYPDAIKKTTLFYNQKEQQQLEPLVKSMSSKSFTDLQKRLKEQNLPVGITALLFGSPGTGKTETVYQLAKKYNRPVFKVEISETKSKWFGESQKLIKKVFTDYYELKKTLERCPILLFNEADAILGKRKAAGATNTADTENAIQNILLEELEKFDGILFATSNLVDNIDAAFERRFLFKIKLEEPCLENAVKIWKSKMPFLSKSEANQLAVQFKFSGGEMENIARKYTTELVVLGKKPTFDKIIFFCENEKWNNTNAKNRMGFS